MGMYSFKQLSLLILLASVISACGITRRSSDFTYQKPVSTTVATTATNNTDVDNLTLIEHGVASWYGPNFHGKLTANGEVYDMDGLTAAHRTLPFGTELLVLNIDNGNKVTVRINDRGPYAKDRIIDLSRAAAKEMDMMGPGTANVQLFLLKGDFQNVTNLKVPHYSVQLGSFKVEYQAQSLSSKIKGSRVEHLNVRGEDYYRVYFGTYTDADKANNELLKLKRKGFSGFVKQIENN